MSESGGLLEKGLLAIAAAAIGASAGWIVKVSETHTNHLLKAIDGTINLVDEIESMTIEEWLREEGVRPNRLLYFGAKIQALAKSIVAIEDLCRPGLSEPGAQDITRLRQAATLDDVQADAVRLLGLGAGAYRAVDVTNRCADIRVALTRLRGSVLPRRFWRRSRRR